MNIILVDLTFKLIDSTSIRVHVVAFPSDKDTQSARSHPVFFAEDSTFGKKSEMLQG